MSPNLRHWVDGSVVLSRDLRGEFERTMIRQRVRTGLKTIKAAIERDGKFTSKAGVVHRRLGRPGAEPEQMECAPLELAKGLGIGQAARLTGLGTGTVHKLKQDGCRGMICVRIRG
jgi:hypothetical protein